MARACTVTPVQSAALAESVLSHGVAFRKVQQELFVQSVSESCFPELGAGSFGNSNTCNSDTRCHLLGRHRRPGAGLRGHVHSSSNPRCESAAISVPQMRKSRLRVGGGVRYFASRVSDSVCLGWNLRMCISGEFPGAAAGLGGTDTL